MQIHLDDGNCSVGQNGQFPTFDMACTLKPESYSYNNSILKIIE